MNRTGTTHARAPRPSKSLEGSVAARRSDLQRRSGGSGNRLPARNAFTFPKTVTPMLPAAASFRRSRPADSVVGHSPVRP
jgi:hypothetical protein